VLWLILAASAVIVLLMRDRDRSTARAALDRAGLHDAQARLNFILTDRTADREIADNSLPAVPPNNWLRVEQGADPRNKRPEP
jgi:hypothetical protein